MCTETIPPRFAYTDLGTLDWPETTRPLGVRGLEGRLVRVLDGSDGTTLSIGEGTEGVDWQHLQLGMKLECELERYHGVRVVRARVLTSAPEAPAAGGPGGREP